MSFMDTENDTPAWTVIFDRFHYARRPYRCDTCGGQIASGEQYRRIVGKQEGRLDVFREHGGMCDLTGGGDLW